MSSIDFTTEELLGLAASLDLSTPAAFSGSPIATWSNEIRREVEDLGMRSLIARGLARVNEAGEVEVPTALTTMCRALCEPFARCSLLSLGADGPKIVTFYARHDATAGLRPSSVGNHAVSLFPTEHLADAIVELLQLPDAPAPDNAAIDLGTEDLQRLTDALAAGIAESDPTAIINESGINDDAAAMLQQLAVDGVSAHVVRIASPSSNGRGITGSVTVWIDRPESGLYLVEPGVEASDATVRIMPADRPSILRSIAEGCPDWIDLGGAQRMEASGAPA